MMIVKVIKDSVIHDGEIYECGEQFEIDNASGQKLEDCGIVEVISETPDSGGIRGLTVLDLTGCTSGEAITNEAVIAQLEMLYQNTAASCVAKVLVKADSGEAKDAVFFIPMNLALVNDGGVGYYGYFAFSYVYACEKDMETGIWQYQMASAYSE